MRAVLDGEILPVDSGSLFSIRPGVQPSTAEYELPNAIADRLYRRARRNRSVLLLRAPENPPGKRLQVFAGLTIMEPRSGSTPNLKKLKVADRRWAWRYISFYRAYNLRRKSGRRRRIGQAQPLAAQSVIDDQVYAEWSLKNGTDVVTAQDALEDVLIELEGIGGFADRGVIRGTTRLPPLESVELRGTGDACLAQLLAEIGAPIDITVASRGVVVLFNRLSDLERRLVGAPLPTRTVAPVPRKASVFGTPYFIIQDRRNIRPSAVRVLFETTPEIRVDCADQQSDFNRLGTVDPSNPPALAFCVVISPEDFTHQGREILIGQVVELEFYLSYLRTQTPPGLPGISLENIRRLWLQGLEYYAAPEIDPSGKWALRIDAIRTGYRRLYQLEKIWRDRLRSLKEERVAIEDLERGARAQSPVYANYAQYETWRARGVDRSAQPEFHDILQNRFSNPQGQGAGATPGPIFRTAVESLTGAKATVQMVDPEQFVFAVEYGLGTDTTQQATNIVRSAIEGGRVPSGLPSKRVIHLREGILEQVHEVSIIFTAELGAPADNRRFFERVFTFQDVVNLLPQVRLRTNTPPGRGPVLTTIVSPTVTTARVGWDDSRSSQFFQAFSATTSPLDRTPKNGPAELLSFGNPLNAAELEGVAQAAAVRAYVKFLDRVEGSLTTNLDPTLAFNGDLGVASGVTHELDKQLGAISRIEVPTSELELELLSLLPKSVRRIVSRLVDLKS